MTIHISHRRLEQLVLFSYGQFKPVVFETDSLHIIPDDESFCVICGEVKQSIRPSSGAEYNAASEAVGFGGTGMRLNPQFGR